MSANDELSSLYHVMYAEKFRISYPPKCYIPSGCCLLSACIACYHHFCYPHAMPAIFAMPCIVLLLLLACAVSPELFRYAMRTFTAAGQQMLDHVLDHQALAIGCLKVKVRAPLHADNDSDRSETERLAIRKVDSDPFTELGYEFPLWNILRWPFTWVQLTYLRPGYLVVEYGSYLVVNAHFATGVRNRKRMAQVRELGRVLAYHLRRRLPRSYDAIVLCCDTNAHCDQPEIAYIERELRLQDCWVAYQSRAGSEKDGFSWSNSNPLVQSGCWDEPNSRIDYIWVSKSTATVGVTVTNAQLVATREPVLSDHYGICSVVEIQKNSQQH